MRTALLDACVLYPAPLRDLLLNLAVERLFRARWTAEIHDEWTRNLQESRPDIKPAAIERTRALMNQAVPDSLVTGHMELLSGLDLPDPDDRHVLAAAIVAQAEVIVTFNEKDFPEETLAAYQVRTQHPDDFVAGLIASDSSAVCRAVKNQRANLRNPPVDVTTFLDTLRRQGLPVSASQLQHYAEML